MRHASRSGRARHAIAPLVRFAALVLGAALALPALSQDRLTLVLNWVPGAEHAPFFFAAAQGWYREAGIELAVDSVTGSPAAVKRAAAAPDTVAVADFVSFLRERASGVAATAVMVLEPRSPYAVYSTASRPIDSLADLAGKRVAAQPADPLRTLWPAFSRSQKVAAEGIGWVDLANPAKPDALAAGEADAAFNPFLHNHLNYVAVLGDRMRVLWWHEAGFPAYGHVLVANTGSVQANSDVLRRFVAVTQRAWAACLAAPRPCIDVLLADNPQLEREHEEALWRLVEGLYGHHTAADAASLGRFEAARVAQSARYVHAAFRVPELEPGAACTNVLLDAGAGTVR